MGDLPDLGVLLELCHRLRGLERQLPVLPAPVQGDQHRHGQPQEHVQLAHASGPGKQ